MTGKEVHVVYYGYGPPEGFSEPIATFDDKAAAALFIFESKAWWKDAAKIKTLIVNEPLEQDMPT